jgi:hypothetical protein
MLSILIGSAWYFAIARLGCAFPIGHHRHTPFANLSHTFYVAGNTAFVTSLLIAIAHSLVTHKISVAHDRSGKDCGDPASESSLVEQSRDLCRYWALCYLTSSLPPLYMRTTQQIKLILIQNPIRLRLLPRYVATAYRVSSDSLSQH